MSETETEVILYDADPANIERLRHLFAPAGQGKPDFGGYHVENAMIFENAVIARIVGAASLDTSSLVETLSAVDPDWLFVRSLHTQISEVHTTCLKKGKKNTTRKTLLKNIRRLSKQIDLYIAAVEGEAERLGELLNDEAVDLGMLIDGAPLLLYLMRFKNLKLFKLAVERGADIHELVDTTQWFEVGGEQFQVVKGMSLLHIAIRMSAGRIFRFLVNRGLDVNAVDENGEAPINYVAAGNHKFVAPLVKAGADINAEDRYGWTPLFALLGGSGYRPKKTIALAEAWMALGADIRHVSKNGTNAMWVAMRREKEIVDFVERCGVASYKIPEGFYDGMSLEEKLYAAIGANDSRSLLGHLDPDVLDKKQQAGLLHRAVNEGRMEAVKSIVESGVPAYLMDRDGIFAYQVAQLLRYREMADFLKEQMAGFAEEKVKRIERARPLYDRFIEVFEQIGLQENKSGVIRKPGWRDLSSLEEFADHYFMEKFQGWQLDHWSRSAVSPKKNQLKARVDDEFNVTFSRPSRYSSRFEVTISTEGEPEIIDLGNDM